MGRSELAIVIPALNEGDTIADVVREAGRYGHVVVVNDGSRDETGARAREAGAVVVDHPRPQGYDSSIGSGFAMAVQLGVKYVLTLDADGQHPVDAIPRFQRELEEGADVAAGVRPAYQRFTEKLFAWAMTRKYGLHDPLCGMKGYRVEVYQKRGHFDAYRSVGTELMLFAAKSRMRVKEIGISIAPRRGASRFGARLRGEWKILRALVLSYFRI